MEAENSGGSWWGIASFSRRRGEKGGGEVKKEEGEGRSFKLRGGR